MGEALAATDKRLAAGAARTRLGAHLADAVRERLLVGAPRLEIAGHTCLVHGDLGGRNIVVAPGPQGVWRINGLIDWDGSFFGSSLWDVGSLFRYVKRYTPAFRERFAAGYRAAGGSLPPDWWAAARPLDATPLVGVLSDTRDLPTVHAECRDLLGELVAGLS